MQQGRETFGRNRLETVRQRHGGAVSALRCVGGTVRYVNPSRLNAY